jgi:hypothetical protein
MDRVGRVNMRCFMTMLGLALALSFAYVVFAANGWFPRTWAPSSGAWIVLAKRSAVLSLPPPNAPDGTNLPHRCGNPEMPSAKMRPYTNTRIQ